MQLDMEVLRNRRHEDEFQASGDPRNATWLKAELRDWLRAQKWSDRLWREFELVARQAGRSDVHGRVRL